MNTVMHGVVKNGVIVPEGDALQLPEGTRVRFEQIGDANGSASVAFADRYADLCVDSPELPPDLASQHDHYRLGSPKR